MPRNGGGAHIEVRRAVFLRLRCGFEEGGIEALRDGHVGRSSPYRAVDAGLVIYRPVPALGRDKAGTVG